RVLRGRADEESREQIGERRVVLPVAQEAADQIRTPEQRTVERVRGPDHDVVPPAGADGPAVDQELLGREPRQPGLLVDRDRVLAQLSPRVRRMDVHLDYAWIRRDLDAIQLRVRR